MMKTVRLLSRNFKQARISGGRVIMAAADESMSHSSLNTVIFVSHCVQAQRSSQTMGRDRYLRRQGGGYQTIMRI